jgi:hypothetical protein
MQEKELSDAVFSTVHELQRDGVNLGPSSLVAFNLRSSMMTSMPRHVDTPFAVVDNGCHRA